MALGIGGGKVGALHDLVNDAPPPEYRGVPRIASGFTELALGIAS